MGNRAVITIKDKHAIHGWSESNLGIYLHWNGGRDSVEAFLTYCKIQGFRSPDVDNYGWARLAQVIGNFFGGDGLSVGLDICRRLDCKNGDNGVYIIDGWDIVGREYFTGREQDSYDLEPMLQYIDEQQPAKMQLGPARIADALAKLGGAAGD